MDSFSRLLTVALFLFSCFVGFTVAKEGLLVFQEGVSDCQLANHDIGPQIWISKGDSPSVLRAARDLALDFGRVVGVNGTIVTVDGLSKEKINESLPAIIAGTIGHSTLIDDLVLDKKLDITDVKGKWEAYTMALVRDVAANVPWGLVIAGSDRRGTIYGLYEVSEKIGVSPWYWWADVPPKTKKGIWVLDGQAVQDSPSIKYRGFFINDEAPALTGWATKKFGLTSTGRPFSSEFYKLVFELCLRLRANYIWPAMWGSAFYTDDTKNGPLAEEYGVVVGTSHHEPMARAEREQKEEIDGGWDWGSNEQEITDFFRGGVRRAADWETMYTMGMRGEGDAASPTLTAEDLEEIIQTQQSLLKEELNATELKNVPQTWVLYKEVGRYYQAGMKVPDTVTLLWTDDNSGNLLRTPLANETDRLAGAGVYYHFDYVGSPRNYKWINTIQLVKTWEQMHLAYEKGAREIWIANVGDIKPLEIPMTHFLDMAYDMSKHATPESTTQWIRRWAAAEFEERIADRTVQILSIYGKLLIRRKYELLSRKPFAYSLANYDEAERVLKEWSDLLEMTQNTYNSLPQATRTPFFEMVLHPILAGKTVVELYIKSELNAWRFKQRRTSANTLANDVITLFAQDSQITDRYHKLNGGKWDGMMTQPHIGYTSWNDPVSNTVPEVRYHDQLNVPRSGIMGVSVQGSNQTSPGDPEPVLLPIDPFMPASYQRYLDIYTRNNGSFVYKITSNASYVSVANSTGTLSTTNGVSDARISISVDWETAPEGKSWAGLRFEAQNASGSWPITVTVPVQKASVPSTFTGFVESDGVVSIEAEHYSTVEEKNGVSYVTIPHYGRTLSGVKLWPVTVDSQLPGTTAPMITYDFYTFTSNPSASLIIFLGATLNHDPSRPLRYAFSVDGANIITVQPVPTTPMGSEPSGWTQAIMAGGWNSRTAINLQPGEHILRLWLLEPGVVIQKLVVDLGGFKESSLGPPESVRV